MSAEASGVADEVALDLEADDEDDAWAAGAAPAGSPVFAAIRDEVSPMLRARLDALVGAM